MFHPCWRQNRLQERRFQILPLSGLHQAQFGHKHVLMFLLSALTHVSPVSATLFSPCTTSQTELYEVLGLCLVCAKVSPEMR